MSDYFKAKISRLNDQLALAHLAVATEQPALLVFMFHALFTDEEALALHQVDPQQRITTQIFAQFVAYYLAHGYIFVSPIEVLAGLDPQKKYALITFDDGYYNNHLALPILRQYGVSATFFISTHHILANQAFWWDVVYRERLQQPLTPTAQQAEYVLLKKLPYQAIDQYLLTNFGEHALRPVGDLDRPFTPSELIAFAREPEVFLGNHTAHHAILTGYPSAEVAQELIACQQDLVQLTGAAPQAVAYPNGNVSPTVTAAAAAAGLRLGATVAAGKNYLPFAQHQVDVMQLNRFLLWGDQDIERQCALFRTDFNLKKILRPRRG